MVSLADVLGGKIGGFDWIVKDSHPIVRKKEVRDVGL